MRFTPIKGYRLAAPRARVERLVILEHVSIPFARLLSGRSKDAQMGPGESEMGLDALIRRLNRIKAALIHQMRLSNIDRATTIKLRQY
jgi:hypothetical protein